MLTGKSMMTPENEAAVACDFCVTSKPATVICESCLLNYCEACFTEHHPMRGKLEQHQVTRNNLDVNQEKCPAHNVKYFHYCVTCKERLCPKCMVLPEPNGLSLGLPRHPHFRHKVLSTEEYVAKQKNKLLEKIEKVSQTLQSADIGVNHLTDQRLNLELSWLAYKHQVRQEFVSLHELLIDKEKELLDGMEKAVDSSVVALASLEKLQKTMETQEAQLSEDGLKLVQDTSAATFMKDYQDISVRYDRLCENIKFIPHPDDVMPQFLKMPFSLLVEKMNLDNVLNFRAYGEPFIIPKSRVTYIASDALNTPVQCSDLWEIPVKIPASTSLCYDVKIYVKKLLVMTHTDLTPRDFIFNATDQVPLISGSTYILNVVPVYTCYGYQGTINKHHGDQTNIMVVAGNAYENPPKAKPHRKPKIYARQLLKLAPENVESLVTEDGQRFIVQHAEVLGTSFEEDISTLMKPFYKGSQLTQAAFKQFCFEKWQMLECYLGDCSFEEKRVADQNKPSGCTELSRPTSKDSDPKGTEQTDGEAPSQEHETGTES